jgi:hypothetical protein
VNLLGFRPAEVGLAETLEVDDVLDGTAGRSPRERPAAQDVDGIPARVVPAQRQEAVLSGFGWGVPVGAGAAS